LEEIGEPVCAQARTVGNGSKCITQPGDAKMMVKMGDKGYALGTNYIYEIDLVTYHYK